MGEAWCETTLSDVIDFRNGKSISADQYSPVGTYPIFGSNGQIGRTNDVLNPEATIAIGRVGAYCGSVYLIPTASWVTDNAIIANAKPGNDLRFLYYMLGSIDLRRTAIGSAQPLMTQGGLKVIGARIPPLAEQRAIASVLGALDDKIESNRRTSRALERLARAIFRAWFVDFEPVKAKAAGATTFPGMPQEAFDSLPTRLVESELGLVPEGWGVKEIGECVTVKGGSTPSTKNDTFWSGGEHHWLTPKDLSKAEFPILLDTERRITEAGLAQISSGLLPVGAVLLSSRAPVGYLTITAIPTAINQGFIAMVCDKELPPVFVYHWTQSVMDEIKSRASGTTFAEISKSAFRPIKVCTPTPEVVAAFSAVVDRKFDLLAQVQRESVRLAAMRDYLLPKLLSGGMRVQEGVSQCSMV